MHKITRRKLTIEFEVWEPFEKKVIQEIGELAVKLRTGELLPHVGKLHMSDVEESVDKFEESGK